MDSRFHWYWNIGSEITFEKEGRKINRRGKGQGAILAPFLFLWQNTDRLIS